MFYCPGHIGVRGNERPDSLASVASITGMLTMGRAVRTREINDSLFRKDTVVEKTAQLRLQQWGIRYGTGSENRKGHDV